MEENKDKFYSSLDETKQAGLDKLGKAMAQQEMSVAGFYSGIEEGISVRPPFSRKAYERFRPDEAIPTQDVEIMTACRSAYESVGVIRSVVDLITETAIEGLCIVSENEATDNFFKKWSERINLKERAERFANYFIVEGNVAVRKKVGSIDIPEVRRMKRDSATAKSETVSIPLEYFFYDPQTLVLIGGSLAIFSNIKSWGIKITSGQLVELSNAYKNDPSLANSMPKEIKKLLEKPQNSIGNIIPIPKEEIYVAHYKKKDSDVWAKSFIYSILHDVVYNEKLRLAKISALDSWYNSVRLWKLGDHKEQILPDTGSIVKLAKILENHTGGTLDVIWDSMLSYEQFFPPIEKLENFKENYESMLLGLGVHKGLIGGDSNVSGGSDAFVGLRNLMKRIDCVRRAISDWLNEEISSITEEMGLQNKPQIKFSTDNLFDQPTYFKLLLELVDRNVISNQTVVEKIGEMWNIEKSRLSTEETERKEGITQEKFSPFIQTKIPESNHDKKVDFFKNETVPTTMAPLKDTGRPPGSKDTVTRTVKKKTKK